MGPFKRTNAFQGPSFESAGRGSARVIRLRYSYTPSAMQYLFVLHGPDLIVATRTKIICRVAQPEQIIGFEQPACSFQACQWYVDSSSCRPRFRNCSHFTRVAYSAAFLLRAVTCDQPRMTVEPPGHFRPMHCRSQKAPRLRT